MSLRVLLISFTALLLCVASGFADDRRPNIVWLSAEDISPHLGCFGDPHAITPNLDQLAETGIRYTNCFTTAGVCAPCRSGIITGCYQSTLGTHHMRCNAVLPDHIKPFPVYLRESGYYCTNNSKTDYQFKAPKSTWDQSGKKAHWRNRSDKTQPFFAVFNFTGCHESGIASQSKYQSVTKGLSKAERQDARELTTLPPYYPDTPTVREDWKRNYELITAMDHWAGDLIAQLKADGEYENTIIFFWSDHGIGLPRAKRWLYDSGTHIPLIARIPEQYKSLSTHSPGSVNNELISSIDFGPTVLNLAGLPLQPFMQGRAFLGNKLAPTRQFVFGARDRMDERYDIIRMVRDQRYKYIRNYEPFKPYYQYMNTPEKGATMKELRRVKKEGNLPDPAAIFMADSKPVEEFYDTQSDPHELINLAENPVFREQLDKFRQAHLDWVNDTRDIGLIPESEIVIREKATQSRYNILLNAKDSLIGRIRDTASMSIQPKSHLQQLKTATADQDAVVRYWAITGIGNYRQSSSELLDIARQKLDDPSPCVRIAAARALLTCDAKTDEMIHAALAQLQTELKSEHQWGRLHAAIVLDEADELARPLVNDLKACLENQPNKYITRVANRALNELLGTNNQVK